MKQRFGLDQSTSCGVVLYARIHQPERDVCAFCFQTAATNLCMPTIVPVHPLFSLSLSLSPTFNKNTDVRPRYYIDIRPFCTPNTYSANTQIKDTYTHLYIYICTYMEHQTRYKYVGRERCGCVKCVNGAGKCNNPAAESDAF